MTWLARILTFPQAFGARLGDDDPDRHDGDAARGCSINTMDCERRPLHILSDDADLSIRGGRLLIETGDGVETRLLPELAHVALHGGARVSVPCLRALCDAKVPVTVHACSGWFLGMLTPAGGQGPRLRRAHYAAAADPARRLTLARAIVDAKLRMTHRLALRRVGARDPRVRQIARSRARLPLATNHAVLMGLEGAAGAAWYALFGEALQSAGHAHAFETRSRRPPRDGVNALLSYLYAVLAGHCAVAAEAAGLDPSVGLLHSERAGRPALALDLSEPFRVAVVDAAVLAALNNGEIGAEDTTQAADGAVRLTDAGRRKALRILDRRLSVRLSGTETWRELTNRFALDLRAAVLNGGIPDWRLPR
jgi:CRISPR-associated endonuclease Cas1